MIQHDRNPSELGFFMHTLIAFFGRRLKEKISFHSVPGLVSASLRAFIVLGALLLLLLFPFLLLRIFFHHTAFVGVSIE
jgi:hypothetical protein